MFLKLYIVNYMYMQTNLCMLVLDLSWMHLGENDVIEEHKKMLMIAVQMQPGLLNLMNGIKKLGHHYYSVINEI